MAFTGIFGVSKFSDKFMEFLSRAEFNVFVLDIFSSRLRPLQFNYLSYKLFLEKKSCQTPKKKEKKVTFGVLRTKVVLKFSVRLQKKKKVQVLRIFFVRVIQSTTGSYHCCSRASDLRRYTSHPPGYRD